MDLEPRKFSSTCIFGWHQESCAWWCFFSFKVVTMVFLLLNLRMVGSVCIQKVIDFYTVGSPWSHGELCKVACCFCQIVICCGVFNTLWFAFWLQLTLNPKLWLSKKEITPWVFSLSNLLWQKKCSNFHIHILLDCSLLCDFSIFQL